MGQQASLQLPHSQHSSQQGEQVERVPSDRAREDTYDMSDDDYREDRIPSTSMTREYAI